MLESTPKCRICKRGWDVRVNALLDSAMTKQAIVAACAKEGMTLTRFLLDKHIAHRVTDVKVQEVSTDALAQQELKFAENDDDLDAAYEFIIKQGLLTHVGRPIATADLLRAMKDLSTRQLTKRGLTQNAALEIMKQLTKKKHGPDGEAAEGADEPVDVQSAPPRPANDEGQAAAIVPHLWGSPGAAR